MVEVLLEPFRSCGRAAVLAEPTAAFPSAGDGEDGWESPMMGESRIVAGVQFGGGLERARRAEGIEKGPNFEVSVADERIETGGRVSCEGGGEQLLCGRSNAAGAAARVDGIKEARGTGDKAGQEICNNLDTRESGQRKRQRAQLLDCIPGIDGHMGTRCLNERQEDATAEAKKRRTHQQVSASTSRSSDGKGGGGGQMAVVGCFSEAAQLVQWQEHPPTILSSRQQNPPGPRAYYSRQ